MPSTKYYVLWNSLLCRVTMVANIDINRRNVFFSVLARTGIEGSLSQFPSLTGKNQYS
jgi:hypothetical protein